MDMLGCITLCLLAGASYGLNTYDLPSSGLLTLMDPDMDIYWTMFKNSYNRSYANADEEIRRRLYWEDNMRMIEDHNMRYDQGEFTFTVGENQFSDLAEDEFQDIYMHGVVLPEEPEYYPEALTEPDPEAELSMDWRPKGKVSPVRYQGSCGSCWAFSALGALESQEAIKRGVSLTVLSEQNLVDCANSRFNNFGCRGGWMNNAYNYIKSNGGVDRESCYRYEARDGYCRFRRYCVSSKVNGAVNVGKSEHSLQQAVSSVGPMAIAMDVNDWRFSHYKSGVYNNPNGNKHYPTHAMVIVGYGTLYGQDVWVIKNSWDTTWGVEGYLYLARNKGDPCGVSLYASYPSV